MSDVPVPSYRIRPVDDGSSWRMLAIAGSVLGVLAAGGAAWWGLSRAGGPGSVPVVEPDPRPVKIRPADAGGLRVGNQDEIIFERNARERATPQASAQLAPEPEGPAFDRLRAQVAPPPAPVPAEAPGVPDVAPATGAPPPPSAPATAPPPAAPPAAATAIGAAPPVALPAPVPQGRVAVQLGALPAEEAARAEWDRLARRMPELLGAVRPQFLRAERPDQPPVWRIRVGGFADAETARGFCDRVRAGGGACVLTAPPPARPG